MCTRFLEKDLPPSLCVDDVQSTCHKPWLPRALRSPVLVLVVGDVAHTLSADSRGGGCKDAHKVRFLYAGGASVRTRTRLSQPRSHTRPAGSEFERNRDSGWTPPDELEPGFVHMVFYGSVTVFTKGRRDCVWRPRDTAPVESSLVVLPRVLPESRLDWCTRQFESSILKSAQDSTWLVERDSNVDAYCERGLCPRWILKIQRLRAREEAERSWEARQARKRPEPEPEPKPEPKRHKLA